MVCEKLTLERTMKTRSEFREVVLEGAEQLLERGILEPCEYRWVCQALSDIVRDWDGVIEDLQYVLPLSFLGACECEQARRACERRK